MALQLRGSEAMDSNCLMLLRMGGVMFKWPKRQCWLTYGTYLGRRRCEKTNAVTFDFDVVDEKRLRIRIFDPVDTHETLATFVYSFPATCNAQKTRNNMSNGQGNSAMYMRKSASQYYKSSHRQSPSLTSSYPRRPCQHDDQWSWCADP